jgi:hypothetical protein
VGRAQPRHPRRSEAQSGDPKDIAAQGPRSADAVSDNMTKTLKPIIDL